VLRNSRYAWGRIAIAFHWLLAALIFVQFALGWTAVEVQVSPQKLGLFIWHKSVGVSILLLVLLRLGWRLGNEIPAAAAGLTVLEKRLARAGHGLLYLLMLAVPLTGWWISDTSRIPFRLFRLLPAPDLLPADRAMSELAARIHGTLTTLLLIVIGIHVAAALRHHFLLHNETLRRMFSLRVES